MVGSRRTGRIGVAGLVFLLMVASCGDDDADVTATTAPATTAAPTTTAAATTTAAPATTAVAEQVPTLVWTAESDCVYSGPDTFPKGEIIKFTYRNESSVPMAVLVDPGPLPNDIVSYREVDPDTELTHTVLFSDVGAMTILCSPGVDQFVEGGRFTVEE